MKEQCEQRDSLDAEQRNMWVQKKLDLASQLQMHAQARRLTAAVQGRSERHENENGPTREAMKEVKDLEQRVKLFAFTVSSTRREGEMGSLLC